MGELNSVSLLQRITFHKFFSLNLLPSKTMEDAEAASDPVSTFAVASSETAHTIGEDSWLQMTFVLVTSLLSAYVLGYTKLVMAPLGWIAGVSCVVLGGVVSLYANCLLASLHFVDGKRQLRYRDLARTIYGSEKMYKITWVLQYSTLFTINIGFVILAGEALKAIFVALHNDGTGPMKLPYWIAVAGVACFCFAFFIPHLSSLRLWMAVSMLMTMVYVFIAIFGAARDGHRGKRGDYKVYGTPASKFFNAISAIANTAFIYNTGIVPELQATLRQPAVANMKKALFFQFAVCSAVIYCILGVGYWVYGFGVSTYLLNDIHASKVELVLANTAVFLQTVIAQHIFASPIYELCDTKFSKKGQSPWTFFNSFVRFSARGAYMLLNTFIAACFPFLGDFTNLTGALSFLPLTFVLANHMHLVANGKAMPVYQRLWHWCNVVVFALLSLVSCIAATRLIVLDSSNYHVFADL